MTALAVRCRRLLTVVAMALAVLVPDHAAAAGPPVVAAASDLNYALPDIAGRFTAHTGLHVRLSFGSSGNFARQIAQGARFELFMSADEAYVRRLRDAGLTEGAGDLYAIGRLALFVPQGSPLDADPDFAGLRRALGDGRLRRFAIANPDHAPYGRAAREALEHARLWTALQGRLVLGENASQATQFAISGSADGGLIPYSQALVPRVAARGSSILVPADRHAPLRQRMVLLKGAGETARRFYDFLRGAAARAIFTRYGFTLPGVQ
jgi:molybdate transport system substrate-binding protein